MSRSTIADVAQLAGVSKSTVSRVLSGNAEYMRKETFSRVEGAIAELGYRPSSIARSLTSKRTFTAGILVSDVSNPFYPEVIHGVEDVALVHNYDIFLCNTNYNIDRGMTFIRSLADKQVDGVLIMSSIMSNEWLLELAKYGIPAVVLDWKVQAVEGIVGVIDVDFNPGIQAAVDHLVKLGHRRFAHVSGPLHLQTSCSRRDAFLNALATHGIDTQQVTVIESNLQTDGGRQALAQLMKLPVRPTAVFAANDLMAMGIVRAVRANNMQVPADLSVVGLDNIWLIEDMEPPLTTVALPRYEIGQLAMQMLFDLLQEPQIAQPIYRQQVETHFVIRQSTVIPRNN